MNKKKCTVLLMRGLVCAAVVALAVSFFLRSRPPVTGTSFIMNTVVEYKLYGRDAERAKIAVEAKLRDIENRMSLYVDTSDISWLNVAAGHEFVELSPDTLELLTKCIEYGELSDGIFDITIAPLTAAWDVTAEHPRVPEESEIERLCELVDYRDVRLSGEGGKAMLRREGQAVDVGGIAKGYAAEAARRVALDCGVKSGYISIGGNLMVIGEKPDGEPFKFGVRDPRGAENDFLAVVTLPDSTMATSGDYERYFEQDGVRYHHIIDPRTGKPAETDLMSVSVISPDGAYADFMSTYLFIKGKDFAVENIDSLDCELVVIDKDKNVFVSSSLKDRFTPADQTGSYNFGGAS